MFPVQLGDFLGQARIGAGRQVRRILIPLDGLPEVVFERIERAQFPGENYRQLIQRVLRVKERFGTLDWEVMTNRGPRAFTTRDLRENVIHPVPERTLLTDVDGNRYDVRDVYALDRASQAWLLRYT